MKRSREEEEETKEDHFSNLSDDMLDTICDTVVVDEPWITLHGLFEVIQRCVRISLVSRYHREWWLKRSNWRTEPMDIVEIALTECEGGGMQGYKTFCRLLDASQSLKAMTRFYLANNVPRAQLFFKPLIENWREHVHRSHLERGRVETRYTYKRYFDQDPCSSQLFEVLLALYNIYHERQLLRTELTKPNSYSMLKQLVVYTVDDHKYRVGEYEAPECLITLSCGTVLDTRLLLPLDLMAANNVGRPIYAIHPAEYSLLSARELARNIKASQRLQLAFKECRRAFKPQKG